MKYIFIKNKFPKVNKKFIVHSIIIASLVTYLLKSHFYGNHLTFNSLRKNLTNTFQIYWKDSLLFFFFCFFCFCFKRMHQLNKNSLKSKIQSADKKNYFISRSKNYQLIKELTANRKTTYGQKNYREIDEAFNL